MPFEKIQREKLSQSVTQQIELLILRGILRQRQRLSSDRELSERFGILRPSLREAVLNYIAFLCNMAGMVAERAAHLAAASALEVAKKFFERRNPLMVARQRLQHEAEH